jgi:glycosyltransferase involved in cell wall biosynthesis
LNIGFVTTESPYYDRGTCGIAAYLRALIPALADAGHIVTVFANSKEDKNFYAEDGRVAVYHFRLPSIHWYAAKVPGIRRFAPLPLRQVEWSAAFYGRVARIAAQRKLDVIESTEAGSLFLNRIAPLVIRLHGSELIFRKHSGNRLDLSVRWNDSLEAYSCKRAAAITAPSVFQANEITNHRRWRADRVRVIPNPISAVMLKASLQFARNGGSERVVLYTGRLAPIKGIETLLEAAKLVHSCDPSIRFVLAGPWQMPHPPAAYGLGLNRESANGIHWIGPQGQTEIIDWYKRAELFVMPSYYESFGISAVEAMAFGLHVVATDTSGLTEIIGNNGRGSFVPRGEAKALADAIIRSISQPRTRSENGVQSQIAVQKYYPERVAAETIRLYESVRTGAARKALTAG